MTHLFIFHSDRQDIPKSEYPSNYEIADIFDDIVNSDGFVRVRLCSEQNQKVVISHDLFISSGICQEKFSLNYYEFYKKYFGNELVLNGLLPVEFYELQKSINDNLQTVFLYEYATKKYFLVNDFSINILEKQEYLKKNETKFLSKKKEATLANCKNYTNYIEGGYDIDSAFGGEADAYWNID